MAIVTSQAEVRFDYGDPVTRWFATEAFRITDTAALVTETGERLVAAGIPLYRLSYFQRALHPEFLGTAWFWRRGRGIESAVAPHSMAGSSDYKDNPLPAVFEQGRTMRVRLERETPSFPILRQLKDEGATDYVALPVVFSDGHIDALSVTSDKPGGFSRGELDRMFGLQFMFARIVEIHNLRTTAINLLDTYVGHDAGERILQGRIRRGDGETLRAALWYCDLRGFTPLSDRLPREALLDLLNDYFGCMAAAVARHRGEVLKFIGDAMLAIFREVPGRAPAEICGEALEAAREAHAAAAQVNAGRAEAGKPPFAFGLALHYGDVMYGNIGAPGRLDFTVIGPAVNLVARLESLSARLDEPLLLSQAFAKLLPGEARSLGRHALKGVKASQAVFAPGPAAPAPAPAAGA